MQYEIVKATGKLYVSLPSVCHGIDTSSIKIPADEKYLKDCFTILITSSLQFSKPSVTNPIFLPRRLLFLIYRMRIWIINLQVEIINLPHFFMDIITRVQMNIIRKDLQLMHSNHIKLIVFTLYMLIYYVSYPCVISLMFILYHSYIL